MAYNFKNYLIFLKNFNFDIDITLSICYNKIKRVKSSTCPE